MAMQKTDIVIKLDFIVEQTVGNIKKIAGFVTPEYLISIINALDLEANPRFSKTGAVTDAIQDSIKNTPPLFPFKTKGILLAASWYEQLDSGKIRINLDIHDMEGILDGGHNALAIGLFILQAAMNHAGKMLPKGAFSWVDFKALWQKEHDTVNAYSDFIKKAPDSGTFQFFTPIELLLPRDPNDSHCVKIFKAELPEICAARNNNVQLQETAKANHLGYFNALKQLLNRHNPVICSRIEWKTNDGGTVPVQDLVALAWIPLALITPVKDARGRGIEPLPLFSTYSKKSLCLKQFEKLMGAPAVVNRNGDSDDAHLVNTEVKSAFQITAVLTELYDYIFTVFPEYYNNTHGNYDRIPTIKSLNANHKEKTAPFSGMTIEILSPAGFINPLVCGLQTLLEVVAVDGHNIIQWSQPPMVFLQKNLETIVKHYAGLLSICNYDPQKVGRTPQCYAQATTFYKMAIAGIL